jgi:NitT/TauT family transport system permease protein
LGPRIYSILLAPLFFVGILFVILWFLGKLPVFDLHSFSPSVVLSALVFTFVRLAIAYILSFVIAIPLALLVAHNTFMERLLLPLFDILQSVPFLAFFPLLVVLFVNSGLLNGAAVCILFLAMVWNIVFSLIGGFKVIPTEIKSAAHVFGIRKWKYLIWVLLPAVVPYLVTGSILAWAQGWNIVIVAEVLHTYIPGGTSAQDLLGIGNLMVQASSSGQYSLFMYLLITLTAVIALMNFFVWQKLLHYAEQFRFE